MDKADEAEAARLAAEGDMEVGLAMPAQEPSPTDVAPPPTKEPPPPPPPPGEKKKGKGLPYRRGLGVQ